MTEEWAPGRVVTKDWLHSKNTPDPTPNYWTPLKNSYLNKTEKEEDKEEENILRRPLATAAAAETKDDAERTEAATVEWRRYMLARRQRRKEEESSRKRRRRLESTQEEALMARARLEDLQRQLQRREWENESTPQNVDEDSKTARTHRRPYMCATRRRRGCPAARRGLLRCAQGTRSQ